MGPTMRPAIGYIRVSTPKQGRSGLGIEAQQEALQRFAEAEGYRFAETFTEVESGKHGDDHRPALAEALERARKERAPIIVAKLDRLSRDVQASFRRLWRRSPRCWRGIARKQAQSRRRSATGSRRGNRPSRGVR
jgi:hypothetical protein